MRKILFLLLLLFIAPLAAEAQTSFTTKDIAKWGANPRTFTPVAYVDEDKLLVGMDTPSFNIKRKGISQRIFVVRFDQQGKFDSVKGYDLRLNGLLEQAKLSPDHKQLVLVSKRGSRIDLLRLADGTMTPLSSHVAGQPGFRIDPTLVFSCGNSFYGIGYTYDEQNFGGNSTIAKIDLRQTGAAAFTPTIDLHKIEKGVPNTLMRSFLSPEAAFFVSKTGEQEQTVTRWNPASGYVVFDKGLRYTGSWGAQEYIIYGITHDLSNHELVWGNAKTGERRVLATSPKRFINPVLGQEGNTWVTMEERESGWFDLLAGSDPATTPKKLATHVRGCVLRVGTQGETIVSHSTTGELTLYKFP